MSEWTSIPVKESEKEALQSDKPDGMTWGYYLVEYRTPEE